MVRIWAFDSIGCAFKIKGHIAFLESVVDINRCEPVVIWVNHFKARFIRPHLKLAGFITRVLLSTHVWASVRSIYQTLLLRDARHQVLAFLVGSSSRCSSGLRIINGIVGIYGFRLHHTIPLLVECSRGQQGLGSTAIIHMLRERGLWVHVGVEFIEASSPSAPPLLFEHATPLRYRELPDYFEIFKLMFNLSFLFKDLKTLFGIDLSIGISAGKSLWSSVGRYYMSCNVERLC